MADKVPATANDAIPASVQDAEADTTPTQMLTRQTKQEGGAAAPFGSHTAFFSSEVCERHRIPTHPECAERAQVVRERIVREIPAIQQIQEITPITRQRLLLFHTPKHVDKMVKIFEKFRPQHASSNHGAEVASSSLSSPQRRQGNEKKQEDLHHIDEDTSIGSGTEDAALIAAGAVCDAIDVVMRGGSGDAASGTVSSIKNAFCGVRPPGHHAEPHRAMGFCLFNNVGIGACYLLDAFPEQIKRVTVFDFDVHHGNGTQAKFISDEYPNVQYISTHQAPFYPNTGKPNERGTHGNILNVPLPARTDSRAYRRVFESRVLPAMHAFEPDFILISAGFDAHAQDPLAEIALESEDYHWITQQVVDVAWKHAQGRIVSVLEGGYHLDALAESAAAHVRALVEGSMAPDQRIVGKTQPIDQLASAFASSVTVTSEEPKELRLTVHFDGKDKLLVLKSRSLDALLSQCKNKFNLKVKKKNNNNSKSNSLHDCHGTLITNEMLLSLANDQHVYLR